MGSVSLLIVGIYIYIYIYINNEYRCTIKNREKYLSSLSKKKRDKYKKCAGKVSRFIENSIQTRRNRIKVTKKDMKCFNDNEKKIKEYVKKK